MMGVWLTTRWTPNRFGVGIIAVFFPWVVDVSQVIATFELFLF